MECAVDGLSVDSKRARDIRFFLTGRAYIAASQKKAEIARAFRVNRATIYRTL